MERDLVFLDTILLQQDMRVRLPKAVIVNISGEPGKTRLEVYFDALTKEIVLKSLGEGNNQSETSGGKDGR